MKKVLIGVLVLVLIVAGVSLVFFDSNEEEDDCIKEGHADPWDSERECCSGLTMIGGGVPCEDGSCGDDCPSPLGSTGTCSNCGNGVCEEWENVCSCSEDCVVSDDEDDCIKEGSSASWDTDKECCSGLVNIGSVSPCTDESCEEECISSVGSSGTCSDCGNGICEDWENVCSCSEDCVV